MPSRVIGARVTLAASCLATCWASVACGNWPWRHDMVNQPSHSTSSSSRAPAAGTMPVSGETVLTREVAEQRLHNPVAPAAPVDAGRALYGMYCVPCHGATGAGDGPVSKYFGEVRGLSAPEVQQHADGWLFATITNGTERMPRYIHEITADERWQIVHFLRSLSPKPAAPAGAHLSDVGRIFRCGPAGSKDPAYVCPSSELWSRGAAP